MAMVLLDVSPPTLAILPGISFWLEVSVLEVSSLPVTGVIPVLAAALAEVEMKNFSHQTFLKQLLLG